MRSPQLERRAAHRRRTPHPDDRAARRRRIPRRRRPVPRGRDRLPDLLRAHPPARADHRHLRLRVRHPGGRARARPDRGRPASGRHGPGDQARRAARTGSCALPQPRARGNAAHGDGDPRLDRHRDVPHPRARGTARVRPRAPEQHAVRRPRLRAGRRVVRRELRGPDPGDRPHGHRPPRDPPAVRARLAARRTGVRVLVLLPRVPVRAAPGRGASSRPPGGAGISRALGGRQGRVRLPHARARDLRGVRRARVRCRTIDLDLRDCGPSSSSERRS